MRPERNRPRLLSYKRITGAAACIITVQTFWFDSVFCISAAYVNLRGLFRRIPVRRGIPYTASELSPADPGRR